MKLLLIIRKYLSGRQQKKAAINKALSVLMIFLVFYILEVVMMNIYVWNFPNAALPESVGHNIIFEYLICQFTFYKVLYFGLGLTMALFTREFGVFIGVFWVSLKWLIIPLIKSIEVIFSKVIWFEFLSYSMAALCGGLLILYLQRRKKQNGESAIVS